MGESVHYLSGNTSSSSLISSIIPSAKYQPCLLYTSRYNLARPVGRLSGLESRIEVFPTVLLALPDADLADAAAESARTRTELGLYERPEEAGEGEE